MAAHIHSILIGGAILFIAAIGTLVFATSILEVMFGGSNFAKVAKELNATKKGTNLYEALIDNERVEFGENGSSYRIKSARDYFFVATAFAASGYLGIYDRRYEMYGAKCHPDAIETRSGDAEFDKMFLIQSEGAAFAPALLGSNEKREVLRRLRDAGFTEIQFNDSHIQPRCDNFICARIPRLDGDIDFTPDKANSTLIRGAAKLLRELKAA